MTTAFISEYIADMSNEELYVYIKEVFLMDPDDDWIGHDAEIAINCAMALYGRSIDLNVIYGDTAAYNLMFAQFVELANVLEGHDIITREDLEEISS